MRRALIVLMVGIGLMPVISGPAWAGHHFRGLSTTIVSTTTLPSARSLDQGTSKKYEIKGSFTTSDPVGQHGATTCKGKKVSLQLIANYRAGAPLDVKATSTEVTAANDAQATFTVSVTLPSTKHPDQYTIRVLCSGQPLQKAVNNHAVKVGKEAILPYTGAFIQIYLAVGIALLLVGALLLVTSRRHKVG